MASQLFVSMWNWVQGTFFLHNTSEVHRRSKHCTAPVTGCERNYLGNPHDLDVLVEASKSLGRMYRTQLLAEFIHSTVLPPFSESSTMKWPTMCETLAAFWHPIGTVSCFYEKTVVLWMIIFWYM
ncbi:hypothetical protein NEOLEDRAFT_330996 [Neolentinus lepideus HHB14362 ss-1]|uniref:Uncharacterized protein n=1 Tax=Neolentinus lepideus HHB14362 ss-1 TaxID=1314782 RepID=A0A165STR1_9AGAM|nr:hypothetical protein NEOLEDRAFT_330996 [Neolentinus lepideus HHB14362 ss-1]